MDYFLTRRQRQILEALRDGYLRDERLPSDAELATKLGIGIATIRTHMRLLFVAAGVKRRIELLDKAVENGWIEAEQDVKVLAP